MITPRFSCAQNPNAVIVRICAPAVRASDVEIHVDGTLFSLYVNPYFLRLVFPAPVVEDDATSALYDPASGYLTVTLTKATPGEEFKDLDVLAKLLAPAKTDEPRSQPTIEVIGSHDAEPQIDTSGHEITEAVEKLNPHQREILEAAENDWQLPQQIPERTEYPSISLSTERRYGFLDAYTAYFRHVCHTENEVNELGVDVENLSPVERRQKRVVHEDEKWDEEYYMADYIDDEYIRELISYKPPQDAPGSPELSNPLSFTEQENLEMLRLPRKEYLASPQQTHYLYLTLLTILFSYAYDSRTSQNDPTPESAWTICSLTPAFSALDPPPYGSPTSTPLTFSPKDLRDSIIPSFRRVCAFPLYRSFALAEQCVQDTSIILKHGRRAVLRALLETKRILEHHEVYYIYSKIWMEDFCRWVANDASEDILRSLGDTLSTTRIDKGSLGWDILSLEAAARQEATRGREPDSDDESDPEVALPAPNVQEDRNNERHITVEDDGISTGSSSSSASTLSSSASESPSSSPNASGSSSGTESGFASPAISLGEDLASSSHSSISGP